MSAAVTMTSCLVVPLLSGALCVAAGRRPTAQRAVGVLGAIGLLAAGIWLAARVASDELLVMHVGGWRAPFGVALVADRLSAIMVVLTGLIGLLGAAFAIPGARASRPRTPFYALLHLMLAGCCGLFMSGDLFNFYVWFELVLVSSFGLMVLGNRRAQIEATTKYLALNTVGSMMLLSGIGLLYALLGTLNLADLARRIDAAPPGLVTALGALLLVALGIKGALFPLFFWLPASYHTPPPAISAIFGGLLTKVGVYGLLRLFTLLFINDPAYTHATLLVLGSCTMLVGALAAIGQQDVRRLLSFLVISEVGYILVGAGLLSSAGLSAAIFFTIHVIVTTTALFFISGLLRRITGSERLERMGGIVEHRPRLALLFLLPALSLAGFPPFSGFVAKLGVVQAGLAARHYVVVAAALLAALLTIYAVGRVWTLAFWRPGGDALSERLARHRVPFLLAAPAVVLAALTLLIGALAGPLSDYTLRAAERLLDRGAYVRTVLAGAAR